MIRRANSRRGVGDALQLLLPDKSARSPKILSSRGLTAGSRADRYSLGPAVKPRDDSRERGGSADSKLQVELRDDSRRGIRRGQGGFTLFEMLIAVSIFAVIGVIAFGGLGQMTRTGKAVTEANNRLSELQFAVVYFNRDWVQVSPRKIRNQYGDEESNLIIADNTITFTRSGWSNLLGHKRSNLQRVQYEVVDEQLVRRHWRSLDQGINESPLQVVLLNDVTSMEVEMFDAQGQAIESWPIESSLAGSPLVLSFRLELPDMGQITRLLEIPSGAL